MKTPPTAIVSEMRWRETMEDAHCVVPNFMNKEGWFFGGVFDGHGGYRVADGLAKIMADSVGKAISSSINPKDALLTAFSNASQAEWAQAGYEGSCAVIFLIQGEVLTCANVGDCRIVTVGEGVRQLTRDHNTKNKSERQRVLRLGAGIDNGGYIYCGDNYLAITRAIGDTVFKTVGLLSTPFVSSCAIRKTDRFIVAASDGLFYKVSNKRVLAISRKVKTAEEFAQALKLEVEQQSGSDNLTIIVVQVKH